MKERSRAVWEEALGRIRVKGGTDRERRIFYTSLYRTFERMVDQSEGGRYYSGFDRRVHEDARPFYNDDWMWDTYRNLHALGMLLDPGRKADELQSYVRMYEQWGWVPSFPELTEWGRGLVRRGEPRLARRTDDRQPRGIVRRRGYPARESPTSMWKNSMKGCAGMRWKGR